MAARAGTNAGAAATNGGQHVLGSRRLSVSFLLYLIGFIVFIAGLAWLATVLGVSQTYIMIGAVILLGIGIFTAATRTRAKDPPTA
ncbi:MAG TPA: hypothetical protein VFE23_02550 [Usitatibacter sp.]|nr:hypothetical protein [Usitatibacter sp.]